jgi:hypothetical protein
MTIQDLIGILEQYPAEMQVLIKTKDLHDPDVNEYEMPALPNIVVIS